MEERPLLLLRAPRHKLLEVAVQRRRSEPIALQHHAAAQGASREDNMGTGEAGAGAHGAWVRTWKGKLEANMHLPAPNIPMQSSTIPRITATRSGVAHQFVTAQLNSSSWQTTCGMACAGGGQQSAS